MNGALRRDAVEHRLFQLSTVTKTEMNVVSRGARLLPLFGAAAGLSRQIDVLRVSNKYRYVNATRRSY